MSSHWPSKRKKKSSCRPQESKRKTWGLKMDSPMKNCTKLQVHISFLYNHNNFSHIRVQILHNYMFRCRCLWIYMYLPSPPQSWAGRSPTWLGSFLAMRREVKPRCMHCYKKHWCQNWNLVRSVQVMLVIKNLPSQNGPVKEEAGCWVCVLWVVGSAHALSSEYWTRRDSR